MKPEPDLQKIASVLNKLGFILDTQQPHMEGERYLMMKNKRVLSATHNNLKVIVKIADHPHGKAEITKEKNVRDFLSSVFFSNDYILFPKEIYFGEDNEFLIWATEFISQEKVFVAHDIETQFFLILRAFEEQEAFHATTFEHLKHIKGLFETIYARQYSEEFQKFQSTVSAYINNSSLDNTLSAVYDFITAGKRNIDSLSDYLTHTDFVPHNFRVSKNNIFILDLSSIRFGNKYEGWARFLNYMVIHNPTLEKYFLEYILKNRGEEEYTSLRRMRAFKIGFLLDYYARSLPNTSGDLKELTLERIDFWHKVLDHILNDQIIPESLIETYKNRRDSLRSDEEKNRQREFAIA